MDDTFDITGLDHAELLAALFNGTRPVGMDALHPEAHESMTVEQAREILAEHVLECGQEPGDKQLEPGDEDLDYVCGRPIKVRLRGDKLEGARWYDRDAGKGACARIVEALRAKVAR
jgi:hypothetical protein